MKNSYNASITPTHESIQALLVELGGVFGFKSTPKVSTIEIIGKGRNREIDVGWKLKERNLWIPIEIQMRGNIDSLIRRLELIEKYSWKVVVIAWEDSLDAIKHEVSRSEHLREKCVYLSVSDVWGVKK